MRRTNADPEIPGAVVSYLLSGRFLLAHKRTIESVGMTSVRLYRRDRRGVDLASMMTIPLLAETLKIARAGFSPEKRYNEISRCNCSFCNELEQESDADLPRRIIEERV